VFLGGEHLARPAPGSAVDALPRDVAAPHLGALSAVVDVAKVFSGKEIDRT
jgi:hypothetical protein